MHREDAEALRCLAGEETSFQWEGGSQFKSGQITRLRQGEKCCSLSNASSSDSEMPVLFLFFLSVFWYYNFDSLCYITYRLGIISFAALL